jgi:hypothetical protein
MPTLAAITLNDGQGTPAAVVFTPDNVAGNSWHFNDGGDPVSAQRDLLITKVLGVKKGQSTICSAAFRDPYLDSVTGALLFYDQARVEYRTGYGSLLAKRKNQFAFVKNIHGNAGFKTFVENRESYSG